MTLSPDTQEKTVLVGQASPAVGKGNVVDALAAEAAMRAGLAEHSETHFRVTPTNIFTSTLTGLAQLKHAHLSENAAKSITYAERNDKERNSLPANVLKIDMAINVLGHVKTLLNKHHLYPASYPAEKARVALISPQDMTMEGLVNYGQEPGLAMALFLICPDVFGKFDPTKSELNNQIIHLFWNYEAYAKARETMPAEKVKLIKPLDPLTVFPEKPTRPLAEGGRLLIKLSGSGSAEEVIKGIATQMTAIGIASTIVCENANKLKPYAKQNLDTESDAGWYYHSLGEANAELPPYLICYPSEQVKHLVVLQQKDILIPTVFLYPKGLHEARNLAWAIKQGLSKVVCVPKTLKGLPDPQAEVAKLLAAEGVDRSEYTMVDPSELTKEHFQKPTRTWEQPAQAQSLFDAVRETLAGTQCFVQNS